MIYPVPAMIRCVTPAGYAVILDVARIESMRRRRLFGGRKVTEIVMASGMMHEVVEHPDTICERLIALAQD